MILEQAVPQNLGRERSARAALPYVLVSKDWKGPAKEVMWRRLPSLFPLLKLLQSVVVRRQVGEQGRKLVYVSVETYNLADPALSI